MGQLEFPVIYLLNTNLKSDELLTLEDQIPTLTYDINEAQVVLGKVYRKERALFELRKHKLVTEEVTPDAKSSPTQSTQSTWDHISDDGNDTDTTFDDDMQAHKPLTVIPKDTVKVVKLAWFTDSVKAGVVLPLDDRYLVYEGRKAQASSSTKTTMKPPPSPPAAAAAEVLQRAMADASQGGGSRPRTPYGRPSSKGSDHIRSSPLTRRPAFLHQTSSEHEIDLHLPPIPDYLHTAYACQRPAPTNPPNEPFIDELKKIRTARTLTGDQIGVRAYSSAIATLVAYPYTLSSPLEVARLPGCGEKIALLYQEFKEAGELKEARDDETDPRLAVLKLFYEIWGVGETTAREFYNRGWRDLDDVVEYGWDTLSRVQQIGVKYYDEFLLRIPRDEVESIGQIILKHANKIHKGFQMVIVGGHRRGKKDSGDVDVVLSHPDQSATNNFIEDIVVSLERDKYITHTLTLSTKNSERSQMPVAWKGNEKKKPGSGFDTLDKALVVWQDPWWSTGEKKNPNPHRRVDIIISPWKTCGCAVLGWTSGTTFQRDLRRYCKKEKNLKFDSSGVRSRVDGSWVDLESGPDGSPAPDMLTAERRVFAGLGLEWRPPEERNTG
ncbi:hypothetical protein QBC46DRAFT_384400 [Diplogelasinospora grovesii]|uniref:DNA polymerase n=1 Tax=Diplogelasinospora grovesii TaxID=303347 RepID=A0AAN6S4D9_9PEZI|nr:hypothetical protein QBC46DRAFT_384400 [Diplogelasinospora grovesii]